MKNYTKNQAQEKSNSKRKELVTTLTKGPLSWLELGAYSLALSGLLVTLCLVAESNGRKASAENSENPTYGSLLKAYVKIKELSEDSSFPISGYEKTYPSQKTNQKPQLERPQLDADFYKLIN